MQILNCKPYVPAKNFDESQEKADALRAEFPSVRVKPPETVGESLVTHVVDPAGVLLVLIER